MSNAFGGLFNIVLIVLFLILVSGYLAFNVNYTKAFRVKNKIISTYEQYEGSCNSGSKCATIINNYMKSLGYSTEHPNKTGSCIKTGDGDDAEADKVEVGGSWECRTGYCICSVKVDAKRAGDVRKDTRDRVYYKVVTQINVDIPIINKIMPSLRIFQVSGDTKQIILPD